MSKFWYTASAVPRYQVASSSRCCAGSRSRNSFISGRRKDQPICKWRNRLCALYWVKTAIRRTPELRQLESAKSMIRNLPPKNTAGLARRSVSCLRRLPRPPASTSAIDRCASLCWMRALDSIRASFPQSSPDGARAGAPRQFLVSDLAERSQLGLQYVFPPLHPAELDQEAVTFAAGGASNPFAQARQVTLDRLQLSFDCVAIDFVGRHRFVSEDSAALRCYLDDAADDKNPPRDGLPLVNLDHPRPDRRNQRRVTGQHTEIPLGARHHHHLDHFREQQTLGGDQLELH